MEMTRPRIALLPDRGIVRVAGGEAEKLLQGLVTSDLEPAASHPVYAALLTPQGKLLFDFIVARHGGAYLLETAAEKTAELVKRLEMYRLRARVDISDDSSKFVVRAVWNEHPAQDTPATGNTIDPRLPRLGQREIWGPGDGARITEEIAGEANATTADYHAHRIALGVPEAGKDYAFGDVFPHEANLDLLNGVSFTKGCFVGQEVVSRMQHRGTARKRIVIVEGDTDLQSGAEITAGASSIGTIGSVAGTRGLALVRLDRADEAAGKGEAFTVAGAIVRLRRPDYMPLPAPADTP
jgi:folate-binding protein YgfZ